MVPYRKRAGWRRRARSADVPTIRRRGFGVARERRRAGRRALEESRARAAHARGARRPLDLRHRRQPVLQPAHPAAGDVSAARRLRAAGGSAARRGAADPGDGAAEARFPGTGLRRLGVQLPAGVAAARRRSTTCAKGCAISSGWGASCCRIPDLPADVLAGAPLRRNAFCRTFSDCTTGPRWVWCPAASARSVLRGAAGSGEDQGCADRITCGVGRPIVTAQPDGTPRPQRPQRSEIDRSSAALEGCCERVGRPFRAAVETVRSRQDCRRGVI